MDNVNYYLDESIGRNGVAQTYNPARIKRTPYGAFDNAPFGINVGQYFNGNTINSKYAESLGDINKAVNEGLTVEDLLAEKQSGWDMAANALVNNAVIAGTTLVSGTLGVADGILEALISGDVSKLWNNNINNWAVDTQEAAKEAMPIYRGNQYTDSSIWDKMGTGIFWADLVENLGFTEGMLVPGMAASQALQGLGKVPTMLGSAFISSLGEGSIEAINERNDEVRNKTEIATQRYNELASQLPTQALEQLNVEYTNTIQDIQDDANNAGNFTLGANLALLTLTNSIEFGNLFTRGFSTNRRLAGQLMREGNTYMANGTKTALAKATGEKLVDAFSEGMEEVSQKAISSTASYYDDFNKFNSSLFNPEKRELVSNLISAFGESYANTLQDPQTAEEFASGFITGLIGAPQLRKAALPVKVENNIIGDLYNAYKNNQREQELANTINSRLADDKKFNAYYDGLVRHLAIQEDMNTAIDDADQLAFENAKSAQLISDVFMFEQAGHLDHLKELINNSVDLSDEGIQSIIDSTTKDGQGPFVNNGNTMPIEEVRNLIQQKQRIINNKIETISKYKESLEASYPQFNEEGIKNIIFLKAQLDDYVGRHQDLIEEEVGGINKLLKNLPIEEDGTKILHTPEKDYNFNQSYTKDTLPDTPEFVEAITALLNSEDTEIAYDERVQISNIIKDTSRLGAAIGNLNDALTEAFINPEKTNNTKTLAAEQEANKQQVIANIQLADQVKNASVSDLVQGLSEGNIDFDAIEAALGEESQESKEKVKEAKGIIQTVEKATELAEDTDNITLEELNDFKKFLGQSQKRSQSTEQVLDTSSEAWNDVSVLVEDPTITEGMSREELAKFEADLEDRKNKAQALAEEIREVAKDFRAEIEDLKINGDIQQSLGEDLITGHDGTATVKSANDQLQEKKDKENEVREKAAKKETALSFFDDIRKGLTDAVRNTFDDNLETVLSHIESLLEKNVSMKELGNAIRGTQSYKNIKSIADNIDTYLNKYVKMLIEKSNKSTGNITNNAVSETTLPRVSTPTSTREEINKQTAEQAQTKEPTPEFSSATYLYWKPASSHYAFGKQYVKGEVHPFYEIARTLTDKNGNPLYTEAQLRRIEAVGKFLDEHGAWDLVDSGAVSVGDTIHFVTYASLNEKAGEVVILMEDAQGRIVGDLNSPMDSTFNKQVGLPQFVEKFKEEYEKSKSSEDKFTLEGITTTVIKNYIGKVAYMADHETMVPLNDIYNTGKHKGKFYLGIAMNDGKNAEVYASAGRTKREGQTSFEISILSPLTAKKGQPFLLMATSSKVKPYIPVPILMPLYSTETTNTSLGKAIHSVLEKIPTSDNKNAINIINDLMELISVQEVHINYGDKNDVKITIKPNNIDHQITIYNGPKDVSNLVEQLELGLQGHPFQVSRKYINEDYYGQDYNTMIGEVATANIYPGSTHTVGDWFALNPIGIDGKEIKGKAAKTLGVNPYAATTAVIPIFKNGTTLNINTATWEVLDGAKPYQGADIEELKARAYGLHTNQNMSKPYKTPFGYFDPVADKFIVEPKPEIKSLGTELVQKSTEVFPSAKSITIQDPYNPNKSYEIKVGEKRRIDDGFYPGVSTITDIKEDGTIVEEYYDETSQSTQVRELSLQDYALVMEYAGPVLDINNPLQAQQEQKESLAQIEEKIHKAGLLNNKVREAMWEALTLDQKATIANKKGPKQKQWMNTLEVAFNVTTGTFDTTKLNGTVDDLLSRKALYRRDTSETYEVWDKKKEVAWLQRVLPNLSNKDHLRILEGVEKLTTDDGGYAYGKFKQGVMTIAEKAAKGTLYHEAFHAVVHTLLSPNEVKTLFNEAKVKWPNLDKVGLEEQLAEDFRRYVELEETPILGNLVKLYRSLKHLIQSLIGKELYIDNLYYSITRNKLATRIPGISSSIRYRIDPYSIQKEIEALRDTYKKAATHINEVRSSDKYVVEKSIAGIAEKDLLRPYQQNGNGLWSIDLDRQKYETKLSELKKRLLDSYNEELTDEEKFSRQMLEEQEESYYRRIGQYHQDKLLYDNLSKDYKEYLNERGISTKEYADMTQLEKKVLFKCMY